MVAAATVASSLSGTCNGEVPDITLRDTHLVAPPVIKEKWISNAHLDPTMV